jgi:hypothetical protein
MAMNDAKRKWITELGGKAKLQQALQERQGKKDAILAKISGTVGAKAGEIRAGMKKKATSKDKEAKLDLLDAMGRGQIHEFDLDDMQDGFALSEEDTASVLKAGEFVVEMSQDLRVMVDAIDPKTGEPILEDVIDPTTGLPIEDDVEEADDQGASKTVKKKRQQPKKEPLFADKEIGPAFYQPLVRQGLIPETLVPDKFSQTKGMLDGTFEAYAARLKKERPKGFWGENKALVMQSIKSGVAITSAGVTFDAAGHVSAADEHKAYEFDPGKWGQTFATAHDPTSGDLDVSPYPDAVATLVEITSQGLEAKEDLSGEGGEPEEHEKPEAQADPAKKSKAARKARAPLVAQQMIAVTCATLASSLDGVDESAQGTGVIASSAYGSKVKGATLAGLIKAADAAGLGAALAAGYPAALLACDPKLGDSTAAMTAAGGKMQAKFAATLDVAKLKLALEKEEPDFKGAIELVEAAGTAAAAEGAADKQFAKVLKNSSSQEGMRKTMDKDLTDQFNAEMEEDKANEAKDRAQLEQEKKMGADGMKMAGLLEKKIAEMKKRQMLIKWAANLGGLGFDIASKAIAPLAIGGSAISLAKNIYMAVQRERDWWAWVESKGDMIRAASAYTSAMDNFLDNAAIQAAHYEINAALDLIKIIGAIVECGGISAAAGKAVQATASVAGAIEGVLYEAKKRYDLETAWKQYRLALIRPENRKLGLIAIKTNPTLAKYAVAYGAIIKKDPLVADFMDKCELDAETLQDPDTKYLDKVVNYLEVRMPDDNVVVGRTVLATDWAPSPVELKAACWAAAKKRGESKADLVPLATRSIDAALVKWEKAYPKLKTTGPAGTAAAEELKETLALLDSLSGEWSGLTPMHKKPKARHREMQTVIDAFKAEAFERRKEVAGWLQPAAQAALVGP